MILVLKVSEALRMQILNPENSLRTEAVPSKSISNLKADHILEDSALKVEATSSFKYLFNFTGLYDVI
jgi:hypothetical protein